MEMKIGRLGLVLLMVLFLTSAVSAISISYEDSQASDYPKVVLKEGGFLGLFTTEVMNVELIDNTDFCDSTCYAILKVDLMESKSDIFNDVLFRKQVGNSLDYIPDTFNSEILLLQNVTHYQTKRVLTDQVRCENEKITLESPLGPVSTTVQTCKNISTDIQEPYYVQEYKLYNGEELSPGTYNFKIVGHKTFGEGSIDFVPEVLNTRIEALAWWNSTTLYGNGADGELMFTLANKSYGNLVNGVDYTVAGNTLYLNLNRPYQFTSITIGPAMTVTTNNVTGAVLYLMAQNVINIQGVIDVSNRLNEGHRNISTYTYLGDTFTTPGVSDGGYGGGNSPSQGLGYGGGGEGRSPPGWFSGPGASGGLGATGSYPFGIAGSGGAYITCSGGPIGYASNGVTGTSGSSGGGGGNTCGKNGGSGYSYSTGGTGGGSYNSVGGSGSGGCSGCTGGTHGYIGGGGGGAGGLAGKSGINVVLKSKTLNITSTAEFNTSGTNGMNGGNGGETVANPNQQVNELTGYPGGGGGGGNAGSVYLYYQTLNNQSTQFRLYGGSGGSPGGLKYYSDGIWQYNYAGSGSTGSSGSIIVNRAGGIYTTLNSPSNGTYLVTPSMLYLNATLEAYQVTSTNATFYLWNSTGLVKTQTIGGWGASTISVLFNATSAELPDGIYQWNILSCASTLWKGGYCGWADNNNTFQTFSIQFGTSSYNPSTYEMFNETYQMNVTSTGFVNLTGTLVWENVEYEATTTGNLVNATFTRNIWIPTGTGNKTFHWHVLYGGELKQSNPEYVWVNPTLFSICNSTMNVTYMNITYRDEISLNFINASVEQSTWNYNVTGSPYGKTYIFTNNTEAMSHAFCVQPSFTSILIPTASYKIASSGYSTKTWPFRSLSLSNVTTSQIIYLISLVDSGTSPVTFQVIDSISNSVQANARVATYRDIQGTTTLINDGYTDSAGSIAYFMSPIYPYTISVTKDGCAPFSSTITPTNSLYNLVINCQALSNISAFYSDIDGLYYQRTPKDGISIPGSYVWYYFVNSTISDMSRVRFEVIDASDNVVLYANDSLTNTASCTPNSCLLSLPITAYVGDNLKGRYYVGINGTDNSSLILLEGDAYWRFIYINQTGSLNAFGRFIDNLNSFFYEWGNATQATCLPHMSQSICQADSSCKWVASEELCVARDDINKVEFDRIVVIFFFLSVALFIFGRISGYELNHPGSFVIFMSGLIWLGSLYGLFNFSGLTDSPFLNQYLFALSTTLTSLGYGIAIIRRYSL